VPGLGVGGKTGTAERARRDALGYDKDHNINTFLGAFPMHAPEYVIVMLLDSPQAVIENGARGAGANVAHIAGQFIQRTARFLGVSPQLESEDWLSNTMVQTASFVPPPGWEGR